MTYVPLTGLQVVGFDGSAPVECGRAVPVAHDISDGTYFSLRDEHSSAAGRYSRTQIERFANEDRLTLLPRSLPAYESGYIVYIAARCFSIPGFAEIVSDNSFSGDWLEMDLEPHGKVRVTSIPRGEADRLLNGLGRCAREQADRLLAAPTSTNSAAADQLIDIGLAAANTPDLRKELHVRSALVQLLKNDPDPIGDIFEYFVAPEFPDWTWGEFLKAVNRLRDLLTEISCDVPDKVHEPDRGRIRDVVEDLARRVMTSAHPIQLTDREQQVLGQSGAWDRVRTELCYEGRLVPWKMLEQLVQLVEVTGPLGDLARRLNEEMVVT